MGFGILEDAWDAASDLAEDAWEAGEDLLEEGEELIEEGLDAVEEAVEWLEEKAEETVEAIGDATEWLAEEAGDLWGEILEAGGDLLSAIEEFAEERWEDAANFVDGLADTIADAVDEAWERAVQAAEAAWEGIAAAAEAAWEGVAAAVESAWEQASDAVEGAWDALEDAVEWVGSKSAMLLEDALQLAESLVQWVWEVIKGLGQFLAAVGACLGGEIVYRIAKADNVIANALRPYLPIPEGVRNRLAGIFPNDSFRSVFWIDQASLAANHFKSGTDGMTFGMPVTPIGFPGNAIYLKPRFDFSDPTFKRLLVHELVHVRQYQKFGGELGFACAYGIGYAKAGFDYRKNPMEVEAYRFVEANQTTIDAL